MPEITKDQVVEYLSSLSIMEMVQLTKSLEEKWGVTAAAPIAVAAGPAAGPAAEAKAEEKTEFTVELTSAGDKKIQVIKVVRELTNMGLKEAKDFVEAAPKPLKEGATKEEAESIKKKLEEAGATATIK